MNAVTLSITELGAQGDGVAMRGSEAVHVAFTAPGDTVTAAVDRSRGTLIALLQPGADRVAPPCPHFGPDGENAGCGGCAVQHIAPATYGSWKRDLVAQALERGGIPAVVEPLVTCLPGARRRVVFAARRTGNTLLLGFHRAGTHEVVDISACTVASPRIVTALPLLKSLAASAALGTDIFHFAVLETASGFDIVVDAPFKLAEADRLRIVQAVRKAQGVARLAFNGEIILEKQPPQLTFGAVTVTPPPGAFTQASAAAETVMADLVAAHLGKAKRVADLYAGCGTFALRLAAKSAVHAVEASGAALAALDRAARHAQGIKAVSVEKRDLARRPLMAMELKTYQGLVFDPPRAGAESQAREIARSIVPKVAAVSCNPVTLARDLKILLDGGYRLRSVTPIDQFLWTPHVEVVALLEK